MGKPRSPEGRVALKSQGRVEEVSLNPGRALCRAWQVRHRPLPRGGLLGGATHPKSLRKTYISGESYCRTYDGPGRLQVTWVPYWQFRLLGPQASPRSTAAAARLRLRSRLMPGPFLTGLFGWNGADSRGGVSKYHLGKSVELPISTAGADLPGSPAV
jgi:hypothetical protein